MAARFRLDLDVAPEHCEYDAGEGLLAELGPRTARLVKSPVCALVTDESVGATVHFAAADKSLRRAGLLPRVIVLPAGEATKCVDSAHRVWMQFADAHLEPDGAVVAMGGGVVGDLAGFCAATWMRGVTLVHVPTTLLAMCDSTIGGKTGIDLPAGKNLVGAFHQPRLIVADLATLDTLPDRELRAGLAEVLKCALLRDRAAVSWLRTGAKALLARERAAIADALRLAVEVKWEHVRQDIRDASGRRALLNLGHTTGHAIEAETGYGRVLHGEGVAVGLVVAARIAVARGLCGEDLVAEISAALDAFGLPSRPPKDVAAAALVARTAHDKKRRAGARRMVLPHARGSAGLYEVDDAELLAALTF